MAGIERLYTGTVRAESAVDERERRRDYHFQAIVQSHLLDTFRDSLEEAGFTPSQITQLAGALASLPNEDAKRVLALPLEIRERLFRKYAKEIAAGSMTPAQVVEDLREKNSRYGYTLGYHISSRAIPKERKPDGSVEWNVKGSELDDRDDMRMAYYSEDYLHRYKKKSGNYLYIVRAEISDTSVHKRDLNNRWGRAPYLSIIDELNMSEVEKEIDLAEKKENTAVT